MGQLNGCSIEISYDKLSKKCRSCMYKDYCSSKQREKYAALALPTRLEPTTDFARLSNAAATVGVSYEQATEALVRVAASVKAYCENNGGTE